MKKAQRFRSAERDGQTDQARIGTVLSAIDDAIREAITERKALQARFQSARDYAAVCAGNDYDDFKERDPEDTVTLREFERQMVIAENRLMILGKQIMDLEAVRDLSKASFGSICVLQSSLPGIAKR